MMGMMCRWWLIRCVGRDGMKWLFLVLVFFFEDILAISRFSPSQSFNIIGIKSVISAINKPKLFVPHETYNHVTQIDLRKLTNLGIKGLIFDKDNTLTEPYKDLLDSQIVEFLHKANKVKSGEIHS